MGIASAPDLLIYQLRTLYSTEVQVQLMMPHIVEMAHDPRLVRILEGDRLASRDRLEQLELVCTHLGTSPRGVCSHGAEGLLKELRITARHQATDTVQDVALWSNCRRVTQFKHAMYPLLITLARGVGEPVVGLILERNLLSEAAQLALFDDLDVEAGWLDTLPGMLASAPPRLHLVAAEHEAIEPRASKG